MRHNTSSYICMSHKERVLLLNVTGEGANQYCYLISQEEKELISQEEKELMNENRERILTTEKHCRILTNNEQTTVN